MRRERIPDCGVERFLILLDGPWATLIIRELLQGQRRFTELKKKLKSISAHTLTHRLKRFEDSGLVTRTAFAETPPRVVYELTPLGRSLEPILLDMNKWGLALPEDSLMSAAERNSVLKGRDQPNGYTEPVLHRRRLPFKFAENAPKG